MASRVHCWLEFGGDGGPLAWVSTSPRQPSLVSLQITGAPGREMTAGREAGCLSLPLPSTQLSWPAKVSVLCTRCRTQAWARVLPGHFPCCPPTPPKRTPWLRERGRHAGKALSSQQSKGCIPALTPHQPGLGPTRHGTGTARGARGLSCGESGWGGSWGGHSPVLALTPAQENPSALDPHEAGVKSRPPTTSRVIKR